MSARVSAAVEGAAAAVAEGVSRGAEAFVASARGVEPEGARAGALRVALSEAVEAGEALERLFDLAAAAAREGIVPAGDPFELLEEAAASMTAAGGELAALFGLLQRRSSALQALLDAGGTRARLPFLKLCNGLLARVSRTANAGLRGDVLLLMARVLDVDERSGVNPSGAFHTGNVTETFEDGAAAGEFEEAVDLRLFRSLWGLQRAFSDPDALRDAGPAGWDGFVAALEATLAAFEAQPLAAAPAAGGSGGDGDGEESDAEPLAPKYHTNARLLNLQLRDPTFRRQLLLQALIFLTHAQRAGGAGRHPFPLDATQRQSAAALARRARRLGQALGAGWQADADELLRREADWAAWKAGGDGRRLCAELRRNAPEEADLREVLPLPLAEDEEKAAKRRGPRGMGGGRPAPATISALAARRASGTGRLMGAPELERLWSAESGTLDEAMREQRRFVPDAQDFLDELAAEAAEKDLEEDFKQKNDGRFVWRTLRALRGSSIKLFEASGGRGLDALERHLVDGEEEGGQKEVGEEGPGGEDKKMDDASADADAGADVPEDRGGGKKVEAKEKGNNDEDDDDESKEKQEPEKKPTRVRRLKRARVPTPEPPAAESDQAPAQEAEQPAAKRTRPSRGGGGGGGGK